MAKYTHYKTLATVLIAPQLIVTFVFFIWPAANAFVHSFFFADAFGMQQQFAGFANYRDLLRNPDYLQAIPITLIIACAVTMLTMGFGLLLAVLVRSCQHSQWAYKSLLLWPYAVAPAVAAILWRFLCQPSVGWVSNGLHAVGIDFNYLIYPWQALMVIIVTASWQQLSYNFLFFFAALLAIPKSLTEAAILDGASSWRRFWQITFPLLSPTTFFLLAMNLIYGFFETFGIIDVLTHGGPDNQTTTLIYKVYKDGFTGMDPGGSAAQSVLLMVMVTGLTLLQFSWLEKKGALHMNPKRILVHLVLGCFIILLFFPLYLALVAASHDAASMMQAERPIWPGIFFFHNMKTVLMHGIMTAGGEPVWRMLVNSFVMAMLIASGKITLAVLSAFVLVYFDMPLKKLFLAIIFSTMMLPVEVRIVPTFQVLASFGWLNHFGGLTFPLMVSATATFLFRQFFKTLPCELVEAAILDGAGPLRFFVDILLPLSKTQIASLFIILFVYGWNQYLWPLVMTTDANMTTIVMGIRYLAGVADQIPQWHYIMCVALLAMLPPFVVVMAMQRWFEKGLIP